MRTFKVSTVFSYLVLITTLLMILVSCSKGDFSQAEFLSNAADDELPIDDGDDDSNDDDVGDGDVGDGDDNDDDDNDDGNSTPFELLSLNPQSTEIGATIPVEIQGVGFGNDASRIKVYFGDAGTNANLAKVLSVSDTLIECESPFKFWPGSYTVSVSVDGILASLDTSFSYTIPKVISVDSDGISPNIGHVDGGVEVTISGVNFPSTAQVDFGDQVATCTVSSSSQIICETPSNSKGSVDIKVYDTASTQSYTVESGFTYYKSLSITSVSNKLTNSKKNLYTVKILGSNFQIKGLQTNVRINKTTPKNCTVSSSKIVCKRVSGNPGESFSVSVKIKDVEKSTGSSTWESVPDDTSGDDDTGDDDTGDDDTGDDDTSSLNL